MSASINIAGTRRMIGLKPGDTSEATMLTAGDERPEVVGIVIANNTGDAVGATVRWGDGSADYDVLAGKSVPANDSVFLDVILPLRSGWSIKVTSGTGGALTFTLALVEAGGMLGGQLR